MSSYDALAAESHLRVSTAKSSSSDRDAVLADEVEQIDEEDDGAENSGDMVVAALEA
jgi:hypothetical protein